MSKEIFEMLCAMDRKNIELQIVLQCAPTIAGLKPSNLLIVNIEDENKVRYILKYSGMLGYRLAYDRHRVIFLIFNRKRLFDYISGKAVSDFLTQYGYRVDSFGYILKRFQSRYSSYIKNKTDFPHEVGVLLGYPLADVKGFIENEGRNCICSGYWKVYEDENNAKELFCRFDEIKDEMIRLISSGYTLREIMDYYNRELPVQEAV